MGLYLLIPDADGEELDGLYVGSYSEFGLFRDTIVKHLEAGVAGSRFPTLILHSDCDGEWSAHEAEKLEQELEQITDQLRALPPDKLKRCSWQENIAQTFGLRLTTLYDCFFTVDGEPLVERLLDLARLSKARQLPILFQ